MMQTEAPSSPSFRAHSSDSFYGIATRVIHELRSDTENTLCQQNDAVDHGDDFDFSFVFGHTDSSLVSADDIFCNGQIIPIYPPFHHRPLHHSSVTVETTTLPPRLPLKTLMLAERKAAVGKNELEGVAEGTYCVWTPPRKKTSSSSKRWRFRDLVSRKHNGGQKDSLLFVGPSKSTGKVVSKHASA